MFLIDKYLNYGYLEMTEEHISELAFHNLCAAVGHSRIHGVVLHSDLVPL